MHPLRLFFLCLAAALPGFSHAQPSMAPAHITIHGHQYAIELQENAALIARLGASAIDQQGRHFRGRLAEQDNSWVRLSQIDGNWSGIVSLADEKYIIEDSPGDMDGVSDRQGKQQASTRVLAAKPAAELAAGATQCAVEAAASNLQQKTHSALSTPQAQTVQFGSLCAATINGVCMFAEVEFVFDLQFQQLLGDSAQSTAAAIVNMAEGFYESDLKISFDVITMQFLSADLFSSSTDASTLLDDLDSKKRFGQLSFVKNDQALLHLVTGRNFNGGTAGIAYTDVLCDSFGRGVGTSQLLSSFGADQAALTALVVAHEIGHNFGANHDGATPNTCAAGFIMEPRVSSNTSRFSSCSIAEMERTISAISRPERCFNFPVDVAISANTDNVAEVTAGQAFTTEYSVQTNRGFLALPHLRVVGSVPVEQGRFVAVTLNGAACVVAADRQAYTCALANPGGVANLKVIARGKESAAAYSHIASVGGSTDLLDTAANNNQLVANFSVVPAPPGTIFKDDAEFALTPIDTAPNVANTALSSSEGGGGGGSFAELALLFLFVTLLGGGRWRLPRAV